MFLKLKYFCFVLLSFNLYAQEESISGVVFHDENKDGIFNNNESPIPDVAISNQKDIVVTDKNGAYTISLRDAAFVYVIKPSGYQVALDSQNFQKNYYFFHPNGAPDYLKYKGISATNDVPKELNFPLYKVDESDKFSTLIVGDPQMADLPRLNFFKDGSVPDMMRQKSDFYIVLGDIADDYLDIYSREKEIISTLGIPGYHAPGNHDVNYKSRSQNNHFETFRKEYGPDYYGVNYGKVHFVILNNVNYFGWNEIEDKKGSYFGGIDNVQMEWLSNYLDVIPKNHLIVLNTHIPLSKKFTEAKDLAKLNSILEGRKVLILSGHTHAVQTHWNENKSIETVIAGASCGSWWTGPNDEDGIPVATSMDGSPKGYFVFDFNGTDYEYRFIPSNHSEDYQIRISDFILNEDKFLVANWFVGKPNEKVEISIDGQEAILMDNYTGYDPFMQRTLSSRKNIDNWTPGLSETNHLWKVKLPKVLTKDLHRIEVTATSENGKVYKGYKIFEIE